MPKKLVWAQTWRNDVINMKMILWCRLSPQVSHNPVGNTVINLISWKCVRQIKMKTRGNDTQKLTLVCYATRWVWLGLWGRCVSCTQKLRFIYTPNMFVAYICQSPFLYVFINSFLFFQVITWVFLGSLSYFLTKLNKYFFIGFRFRDLTEWDETVCICVLSIFLT